LDAFTSVSLYKRSVLTVAVDDRRRLTFAENAIWFTEWEDTQITDINFYFIAFAAAAAWRDG